MALIYSVKDQGWIGLLKMAPAGLEMFLKGKIKLMPSRVRAIGYVRKLFQKAEGKA